MLKFAFPNLIIHSSYYATIYFEFFKSKDPQTTPQNIYSTCPATVYVR